MIKINNQNDILQDIINLNKELDNKKNLQESLQTLIQLIPRIENVVQKSFAIDLLKKIKERLDVDDPKLGKDVYYESIAKEYLLENKWDEAKECLDKIKNLNVDSHYYQLLPIYEKKGRYSKLIQCAKKIKENTSLNLIPAAKTCLEKGFFMHARKLAALTDFSQVSESKHDFYAALACNYFLNDFIKNESADFVSKGREIYSIAFNYEEKDLTIVENKILHYLKNDHTFPYSHNLKEIPKGKVQRLVLELERSFLLPSSFLIGN